jgi:D-alanyl-D-alanine carboxypeptidase (penicillin-binding protein 5/6)
MRKIVFPILLGGILTSAVGLTSVSTPKEVVAQVAEQTMQKTASEELGLQAKSAYLMDFATQTPMYALNEEARLPIASMCKIMTLILAFDAMDAGEILSNEEICVSERAASMGGSQVFLEANAKYPINELIKSIIVCSANDSCVALAERIAGSEDIFVAKMNEKAKQLGANNTLFSNCTGLPKEPQYSCAKDVAIMLKELLGHQEYFEYGKVWMDKFQHPKGRYTEITNTNKLVRFYDGCDGGKTGFTNEAGFCLAATAKRNDMRIISVVIGEETSKNRFEDVSTMFNYAFANYSSTPILKAGEILEEKAKVDAGKQKLVSVYAEKSVQVLTKRGEKADISAKIELVTARAPLSQNAKVGEIIVYKDGIEVDRVSLLTADEVREASFFDRLREVARAWNFRH